MKESHEIMQNSKKKKSIGSFVEACFHFGAYSKQDSSSAVINSSHSVTFPRICTFETMTQEPDENINVCEHLSSCMFGASRTTDFPHHHLFFLSVSSETDLWLISSVKERMRAEMEVMLLSPSLFKQDFAQL